jgi:Copper type II ascorbate-dependent monooxygenase, N-terminal domain/Copper type II ascorbate-dependent monooxygenase, C-terminal domain
MRLLILPLLAGCATSTDDEAPTWHRDVQPIVAKSCVSCHQDGQIAPFTLDSYGDAAAMAELIADSVSTRRMPPWLADPDCTPYEGDISLSDDEIATIVAWADSGAPEGDSADAPVSDDVSDVVGLSRVDHSLTLPSAYTPDTTTTDDYRCFVIDWPVDHNAFLTGYTVEVDNPQIVHHLVAYLSPPELVADYKAADEADPGEGYACYGGPGVVDADDAEWLGGWAPGAASGDFPEGTGVYVQTGSAVVLQMHYNTANGDAGPDQSSFDIKVDDTVTNPGIIQPWADPTWLSGDTMAIPANTDGVTHSFSYTLSDTYKIWTSNLHMHTYGTNARMWIDRADGSEDCMLDIPRWDFDWQRSYRFVDAKEINAGDAISIECTWDNPTDQDLAWGEGTGDEMCLGTFLITLP